MTVKELKLALENLPEHAEVHPYKSETGLIGIGVRCPISDNRAFINTSSGEIEHDSFDKV